MSSKKNILFPCQFLLIQVDRKIEHGFFQMMQTFICSFWTLAWSMAKLFRVIWSRIASSIRFATSKISSFVNQIVNL